MESPDTLSQVITRLRQQGYTDDLNRHDDNPIWLDPAAYQVDNVYRFEEPSSPDDDRAAVSGHSLRAFVSKI